MQHLMLYYIEIYIIQLLSSIQYRNCRYPQNWYLQGINSLDIGHQEQ